MNRRTRRLPTRALLVVVAVLATACNPGGGSGASGQPAASPAPASPAPASSAPATRDPADY